MTAYEITRKLVRAILLVAISTFFLLPYFPRARTFFNLSHGDNLTENNYAMEDSSWAVQPVTYTSDNLGINLPWLDLHNGTVATNWLNVAYDSEKIEHDLANIQALGITKVRTFCQLESIFDYENGDFTLNEEYAEHLDDYLQKAETYNISVICVMGAGNYEGEPQSLDGNFRWELVKTEEGRAAYQTAYRTYIERYGKHTNIIMWELMNEPYGELTWSPAAKEAGVTRDTIHTFLVEGYQTVKALAGSTLVGFSDLEEQQQPQYQLYSDPTLRIAYVDDCTDVYSMHMYRMRPDEIADFRTLTSKPKWVVELGAYNYYDPDAIEHPIPAANELLHVEENYMAVTQLSRKLVNEGFTLIMPWAFANNNSMVTHNVNGTHTFGKLLVWMRQQIFANNSEYGL